jgi:cation transport ATPase
MPKMRESRGGSNLRTIKQNLFLAFFYTAVGIPLAALDL